MERRQLPQQTAWRPGANSDPACPDLTPTLILTLTQAVSALAALVKKLIHGGHYSSATRKHDQATPIQLSFARLMLQPKWRGATELGQVRPLTSTRQA